MLPHRRPARTRTVSAIPLGVALFAERMQKRILHAAIFIIRKEVSVYEHI
ncbi:hypothetical protein [Aneurinibacillus sp. REN35]